MAKREGSRTIDRRVFLKGAGVAAGGIAAGGIPAIVAAQKAPSFPKGTKLNILEWVSFVPAS
ncbi:MAG: twin-arginine translocation signal domain-containing protein, partial [Candidatus Rokuibacteriota bacterium]